MIVHRTYKSVAIFLSVDQSIQKSIGEDIY